MAGDWLMWASLAAVAVAFALSPPDRSLLTDVTRPPRRSALILNGPELAGATYELSADGLEVVFRRIDELAFTFGEASLSSIPAEGQGSLIDSATFSPTARALGVHAASLMGLDVADVHMVRHWTTGEWYVLDTSATPLFSTGAFIPDKISAYTAYLQRKLGAETEQDRAR